MIYLLKGDRNSLYRDFHKKVEDSFVLKYTDLLEKRSTGTPLQYILQETYFFSLRLKVIHGVFIPRPETELLVEETINMAKNRGLQKRNINILDLGTGTGAILLSLVKEFRRSFGIGIDINPIALSISSKNAHLNKLEYKVSFLEGDIFYPKQFTIYKKFDIIVSNPPYISDKEMRNLQKEVRNEPILALQGGKDGLIYYPYIFLWGEKFLKEDGFLSFEMGEGQWKEIKKIAHIYNFKKGYTKKDYNNIERIGIVWR